MLSDEKKKRIEALSVDEMAQEINLGRSSRFQREAFAYLKTCYEARLREINAIPNSTAKPSNNNPNSIINKPPSSKIVKVAIEVFVGFLVLILGYIFRAHLGIPL